MTARFRKGKQAPPESSPISVGWSAFRKGAKDLTGEGIGGQIRSNMSKIANAIRLLFVEPKELAARLDTKLEYWRDKQVPRRATYRETPWSEFAREMNIDDISTDEIDRLVQARLENHRGPWSSKHNAVPITAQALYRLCRLKRPSVVVETGVAYGMSTSYILAALRDNQHGRLYSIDFPPLAKDAANHVGALVPPELKDRWELIVGKSQQKLPALLEKLGEVDLFVHDSLHTYRNMRFEFDLAWPHLPQGGILVSDDIQDNDAFDELREKASRYWTIGDPSEPDWLFGVAVK